jgi:hypothetical protein
MCDIAPYTAYVLGICTAHNEKESAMDRTVIALSKSSRPKPAPFEVIRIQRQIWRLVCSASWFDCCWNVLRVGKLRAGGRVGVALERVGLYPPGGTHRVGKRKTLMRRCKQCEKCWYPPQYVRGCGLCEDCIAGLDAPRTHEVTHVFSTASPTTEAIRRLEVCKIHLTEPRLAAEDEGSLRREIEVYLLSHPEDRGSYVPLENTKNRRRGVKKPKMT